jgi:hypothetical protein
VAARISLREYQRDLVERLQNAGTGRVASKLGLQVAGGRWLVDLTEAGEVELVQRETGRQRFLVVACNTVLVQERALRRK